MPDTPPADQPDPPLVFQPGKVYALPDTDLSIYRAADLPTITIHSCTDGPPLVTIHPDGRLEYGPDYDPDQAARVFWDAVQHAAIGPGPLFGLARIEAERDSAQAEVAQLRAGEEPYPDDSVIPTPGQWIWKWNRDSPERRLERAARFLEGNQRVREAVDETIQMAADLGDAIAERDAAQARLTRVRALHDSLVTENALVSPDDTITRARAAEHIATALDGCSPTQPATNPPGSTSEQLAPAVLALLERSDYLSTACDTAQRLQRAPRPVPTSGGPIPDIAAEAARLHARCRLNHKFTGQPCTCGCHHRAPDDKNPAPTAATVHFASGTAVRLSGWSLNFHHGRCTLDGVLIHTRPWPTVGEAVPIARVDLPGRGAFADITARVRLDNNDEQILLDVSWPFEADRKVD